MTFENKLVSSGFKLRCEGHRCSECGGCTDWYYYDCDWNHMRNWHEWSNDDWLRYGSHIISADEGYRSKNGYPDECSGDCPVVDYYDGQYHERGCHSIVGISFKKEDESWWNKIAKIPLNSWAKFRGWWSGTPPRVATTMTYHEEKPKWIYHSGRYCHWTRRNDATCTCPTNYCGYGYGTGGVHKGYLHYHQRDYDHLCMCRNNIPDDILAKTPQLQPWVYSKVPHVNRKWFRNSSDED